MILFSISGTARRVPRVGVGACDTIARIEGQTRWVGDAELVHLAHGLSVTLERLYAEPIRRALRRS